MATIKIGELVSRNSEILQDTDSFLNEITDLEIDAVVGGQTFSERWENIVNGLLDEFEQQLDNMLSSPPSDEQPSPAPAPRRPPRPSWIPPGY